MMKKVKICGENKYNKFVNFKRLLKVPFMIYVDFENILLPTNNKIENPDLPYTKQF